MMKALTYNRYGPPDVVRISDVPRPVPSTGEVLVRVHASSVNTADWRIRAGAFPGITAIPARLLFGIWKPRNTRLGIEFAGVIESSGDGARKFEVGDRVFGITAKGGASAEYLAISEESAVARMPKGISFEDAAALPFGGLTALVFLTDHAELKPGHRVLIVGASGGVGSYAVQVAKAIGANVTAISGSGSQDYVAALGADLTLDYKTSALCDLESHFDVILDTIGVMSPRTARSKLLPNGVFLPLNMGLRELWAGLLNPFTSRKIRLRVNPDTAEDLQKLSKMVLDGSIKPAIDRVYSLAKASEAHAYVENRHRKGDVILSIEK